MPELKIGFKFRNTELTNVYKATEFDELPEDEQDRLGKEKFKILGTMYQHGGKTSKVVMNLSLKLFHNF